jgi:hypothetical protein
MKKILLLSIFFILILIFSGCSNNNEWTGFYYRDKDNIGDQKTWVIQSGLKSEADCRTWVINMAKNNSNYDYECGYKCHYEKTYDTTICKETVK